METREQWLSRVANLKVDKATGDPAPHKPLLLLVILEMAEQDQLPTKILPLTPELAYRFCTFWSVVASRRNQKPDVRYPFYHLKSDRVWVPLSQDGKPTAERSLARLAAMPQDFVDFANDPIAREKARAILIAKYFRPDERVALHALCGMPAPCHDDIAQAANYKEPEIAYMQGRTARFRLSVVAAFNYSCALTRYRLTTITGTSIVDAAHIHPFSDSRNNDPRNGLALSKNAHWLFDHGLWSLGDDYRVIVAQDSFAEDGPQQHLLSQYHGQQIQLPADRSLWPDPAHMAWHRNNRLRIL